MSDEQPVNLGKNTDPPPPGASEPTQSFGSPYAPPPPPAAAVPPSPYPYGFPAPAADHPQGVVILILGILSITFCQLTGPVAFFMGRSALREIDGSGGRIGGRGVVMAGYVTGIIGSLLMIGMVLLLVGVFGLAILGAAAGS